MFRRLLQVACAGALVSGCNANLFKVHVSGQTTVPGSPVGGLLNSFAPIGNFSNLDFNQNQDFKNQGVTKDKVSSVKADSVVLKIISPSSQDFSFLNQIEFHAETGNSDALIASKSNIAQSPGSPLTLDVTNAELEPYVTAPSMNIIVRGNGSQPPQDTTLEADVELAVAVKIF